MNLSQESNHCTLTFMLGLFWKKIRQKKKKKKKEQSQRKIK